MKAGDRALFGKWSSNGWSSTMRNSWSWRNPTLGIIVGRSTNERKAA